MPNKEVKSIFQVKHPGPFTTIQDLGRSGYQKLGIPQSGAMDSYSYRLGNALLGNDLNTPSLEIFFGGLELEVLEDITIAITGANLNPKLNPKLNQKALPLYQTIKLEKGSTLHFDGNRHRYHGAISYLTIQGGFEAKEVLGSRSTYTKTGLGDFFGQRIAKGDILNGNGSHTKLRHQRSLHPSLIPNFKNEHQQIRFIPGPDWSNYESLCLQRFQQEGYHVTKHSDRMGYRLEGPALMKGNQEEVITDATPLGTIQVPPNGKPIILMADRQPTGGYPKLGTVISVDMPYLSQALDGKTLFFRPISLDEAQRLLREQKVLFRQIDIAKP